MKEKILLGIILFLSISIVYINLSPKNKISSNDSGTVKGAQASEYDFNLSKNISKLPQKKDTFYNPDHIQARNYILLDVESASILAAKNEHDIVSIASTTKIMTAIIALENFKLDEIITVKDRKIASYESALGLRADDRFSVYDLLKALMISSANDASYALADHVGYNQFINMMNQKTQYLGLNNTEFKDSAGLNDEGKSTAYDLAFITKYAYLNETFREIIKIDKSDIISENNLLYKLETSNRLIKSNHPLFTSNVEGGKTGFTYEAGHCLVSIAEQDEKTLISVILHTDSDTAEASAIESRKLINWGFENYTWQK